MKCASEPVRQRARTAGGGVRIRHALLGLCWLTGALAHGLTAQNKRCRLEIMQVQRQGVQVYVSDKVENYFAGGDVQLRCRGENVRIWTDSIASYQGSVVQFIGNFRYEDETAKVTSDFGTYYKNDERWEARGNVVYLNLKDNSQLRGPSVNYYRKIKGTRELEEAFAEQRPTLTLASKDSAGRAAEPYIVIADRVRTRGQDLMWAGGTVTIDRSDLRGRGDSLQLDTGKTGAGALIGHAAIRRAAQDSFALAGRQIDLGLVKKELTSVTGRDSATLRSKDLDLSSEVIRLRLESSKVIQTFAWGTKRRPEALADDYQVRGDSLAVDTPHEALKELRAFGKAWVGFKPDSAQGERDWLSGEKIVAQFEPTAPGAKQKSVLKTLEARDSARSFYRIASTNAADKRPSISYSQADRILLTMQQGMGDSLKVQRVDMAGHVYGMQVSPALAKADSTKPKKP